jgi:hypothetical protein
MKRRDFLKKASLVAATAPVAALCATGVAKSSAPKGLNTEGRYGSYVTEADIMSYQNIVDDAIDLLPHQKMTDVQHGAVLGVIPNQYSDTDTLRYYLMRELLIDKTGACTWPGATTNLLGVSQKSTPGV